MNNQSTIDPVSQATSIEVTINILVTPQSGYSFNYRDLIGQLEVSTNGTSFTSLGSSFSNFTYETDNFFASGTQVVTHSSPTPGQTYYYRYKITGTEVANGDNVIQ